MCLLLKNELSFLKPYCHIVFFHAFWNVYIRPLGPTLLYICVYIHVYINNMSVFWVSHKGKTKHDKLLASIESYDSCRASFYSLGGKMPSWRHNERNGVSNHRCLHCLLTCWFRRRSKKTSKFRVTAGRGISAETCGLDDVFPPDDLSSGPYTQSIIRFFFLYIKLMCPYFILLIYTDGERDGLWMACPFRTLVVLYRMFPFIICLILMNYLMELYFIGFVNAHLPGCFCPWTFRLNIGLNTSPSDSFVSYLNSHLGYSAGEFQALQLIVLAVFGAVD